jgi:uncharacterized protein YegJ (DUF2314 family)
MAGIQRILTLVVVAVLTSAHVRPAPAQRGPIIDVPSADAEMNAAIAKARATLPKFWGSFENPGNDEEWFTLKVYFQVDRPGGPRRSHVWVESIERLANGRLAGRLSNDPRDIEGKAGDRVEFDSEQISDWMFMRNGKIVGGETIRVLLPRMPKTQADDLRKKLENP